MAVYYYLYIVALVVGISISIYLISRLWVFRKTSGAPYLIWAISSVVIWSFGYIFEILFEEYAIKYSWSKIEYIGIPFTSLAIFCFALIYSGRGKWLTRTRLILISIVPTITCVLALTNEWHRLLWSEVLMPAGAAIGPLIVGHGPWYNINILYAYTFLLLATFFFAQIALRTHSLYRSQAVIMLVGMIIPWVGNFVYIFRLGPVPSLDWTPLALTLTSISLEVGFARFGLMDILPVAQGLIFSAMREGVIVADAKGRIVEINPAAQDIFRSHDEQLIGKEIRQFLPAWVEWNTDPKEAAEKTHEIKLGEGPEERDYSLRTTPILARRGQVVGQMATLTDVTEQKHSEQQLQQAHAEALEANRMKTQLLASISHDLRTPLGAIMGYTEMIQTGVLGPVNGQQQSAASEVLDSTNQLLAFVNNLISQAQIETGRVVIRDTIFDPSELILAVESTVRYNAQKKGLEIETEIDPTLPEQLYGDPYWLKQILINLTNNAVKYTDKGCVKIRFIRAEEVNWAMQVVDTGVGISQESQGMIFEPFQQAENTTLRRRSGSGLGLSIVKQLAGLMNGRIELLSEVGHGSVFTITFPGNRTQE
jgi:PAS domain S-box-containing protein